MLTSCGIQSASSDLEDKRKKTSTTSEDPNFKDGVYVNNYIEHPDKSFFTFLKMRFFGDDVWADPNEEAHLIPTTALNPIHLINKESTEQQRLKQVTWLGHSTFLLQYNGVNVLTDPVFSDRASPVSFAGPKRYTEVAAPIKALPKIDIVIISHNHYDHLNEESILELGNSVRYFVPSGLKAWFTDIGISPAQVTELRWWQNETVGNTKITATPSQHWSARGLGDRHQTHWASWLISIEDFTFWFAGDTGYNDKDFVSIGEHIKQQGLDLNLSLIPIGAYGPRSFMKTYHVNTEEAVKIHKEVGSEFSIGMHWGTFPLTSERPMEPLEWLNRLRQSGEIGNTPFETLKIGEIKPL